MAPCSIMENKTEILRCIMVNKTELEAFINYLSNLQTSIKVKNGSMYFRGKEKVKIFQVTGSKPCDDAEKDVTRVAEKCQGHIGFLNQLLALMEKSSLKGKETIRSVQDTSQIKQSDIIKKPLKADQIKEREDAQNIESFKSKIDTLAKEVERYKKELENVTQKHRANEQLMEDMRKEMGEMQREKQTSVKQEIPNVNMTGRNENWEHDRNMLQEKIHDLQQKKEKLEDDMVNITHERDKLKKQLAHLEIKTKPTVSNDEEQAELRQQIAHLGQDIDKEKDIDRLKKENASLTEEKEKLQYDYRLKLEIFMKNIQEKTEKISRLNNNIAELEKERNNIQEKFDQLTKEKTDNYPERQDKESNPQSLDVLNEENEELKKKIKTLEKNENTIQLLIHAISEAIGKDWKPDQIQQHLIAKNAENIDRLAAEMNAKVAADESALENISIQCRPMNIAEEYNLLCSNAWLDAKQELDDQNMTEEKSCTFLNDILKIAQEEATTVFEAVLTQIALILQNPLKSSQKGETTQAGKQIDGSHLPNGIITQVGDYLRGSAANIDLSLLQQKIANSVKDKTYLKGKAVKEYLSQAARIAWKMVLQRPPMSFDTHGEDNPWEGDTVSDLFWGSDPNAKGAVVRYYVHPILKHGDKPMMKGKVVVK